MKKSKQIESDLQKGQEIYETIKKILKGYAPGKYAKEKDDIISEIQDHYPEEKLKDLAVHYFTGAINNNEENLRKIFTDIFLEPLRELDKESLAYVAMGIEGAADLAEIYILQNVLEHAGTGKPRRMSKIMTKVCDHATYDDTLIIVAPTGSSKQAVARAIHLLSERRNKPFIEINCAAIPENMLESELFGHVKGAFTDATADKRGLIEEAEGGYFFLDELGKTPSYLQSKLLKVINDKTIRRLGDTKIKNIDVRFIGAIQPGELTTDAEKSRLIPDLIWRMGCPDILELPPLCDRMKAVGGVGIWYVVQSAAREASRSLRKKVTVNNECLAIITSHDYRSGNYRELIAFLRAAAKNALNDKRTEILPDDLELLKSHIEKRPAQPSQPVQSYRHIKLKDIVDYADKVADDIIEAKLREIASDGERFETVLIREGLKEKSQRQSFRNIISRRIRKGIRDFYKGE